MIDLALAAGSIALLSALRRPHRLRQPVPGREPGGDLLLPGHEHLDGLRQLRDPDARAQRRGAGRVRDPPLRLLALATAGVAVKYPRLLCGRGGTAWSTIGPWGSPNSRYRRSASASGPSRQAAGVRSPTIKRSTCSTRRTRPGSITTMSPPPTGPAAGSSSSVKRSATSGSS